MFTGRALVAKPKWNYDSKKKFRPKIDYMLDAIAKQHGRGHSGDRLIRTFL